MRFLVLIIILFSHLALAQQTVKGKLSADATWTGQVRIIGDVIVPKGVTLTIAPGTQVLMAARQDATGSGKNQDKIEITISGKLVARGSKGQGRILFTSDDAQPQMGDWIGIVIKNPRAQSVLQFCTIEYGYKGITTYGSSPQIIDCEIRYNEYAGISGEVRSKPLIQNCNINSNGFAGLISELASAPLVERSIITQNEIGVIVFDRSLVDLGRSDAGASESIGANYIFNNFENNVYNRSSQNIYAQNNLWNMSNAPEIRGTLYDQQQNSGYGQIVFEPIFDDGNNSSRVASRDNRQNNRSLAIPQVVQAPVENTTDSSQPLASAGINNRQNNSENRAQGASPSGSSSRDSAQGTTPVAVTPSGNTNQPAANPGTQPQVGSVEYLADRSNESNAVQSLIENATSSNSSTNPLANLVSSNSPAPNTPAAPQIVEPIIEGLLDTRSRQYVSKVMPSYPEIYKRTGHEGKVLMEVIVARDGGVESHRVLRTDGELFTEAASNAVAKFRYKPGTFQGKPVRFKIVEPFFFRLQK